MVKRFRQTESYKIKQIIFAVIVILIIFIAWLIIQKKELIVPYIAAIVLAVVVGVLGYMFLEYYFIIPLLIIMFIGTIIINAIPGIK